MGRPKEFDRDEALLKAVDVFWEQGYEGTSIQDLVDRMGIHRASLYDTYGNKHQLFIEAMEQYSSLVSRTMFTPLEQVGPVRETLRAFFESVVDTLCDSQQKGCLIVKVAMSNGVTDSKTSEQVVRHLDLVDGNLQTYLERCQENGEIEAGTDVGSLAKYLRNSLQGLFVTAAVQRDRKTLMEIAEWTVSAVH